MKLQEFFAWTVVWTWSEPDLGGSGPGSPRCWTKRGGSGSGLAKNCWTWIKPDHGQSSSGPIDHSPKFLFAISNIEKGHKESRCHYGLSWDDVACFC